jgi:3-dehydroquinate dehydratase-2
MTKGKKEKTMKILIINGANLNLLGTREPEIYGTETFETYLETLTARFPEVSFSYFQSNHEGALIDCLQDADRKFDGIVLNAGAYSHTSLAIADAVRAIQTPVIEVHISNIFARETYRHHSFLSETAKGVISGFGLDSYRLAVEVIVKS